MATLARIYDFTRQKLQRKHLNEEFENYRAFLNAFRVHNPLLGDLDFGGFVAKKFAFKKGWEIVDASQFSYLQHAVDSIEKGIVFLPQVEYSVGAEPVIIDRDDIWLIGLGQGTVIRKDRISLPRSADSYDNSARGNPAVWFKKVSRCRLINVTVDMNETQGVDLDPFPTAAVQANNCPDIHILGCRVKNFGDRHFQQEPRGTSTASFAAIDVRNSDRARVMMNDLSRIRAAGVWCGGLLDYQGEGKGKQIIAFNHIEDADVGVQVVPTNNVQVDQNQFTRIAGSGVSIIDSSASLSVRSANLSVCGNQFARIGINPDTDIAAVDFQVQNPRYHNISICGNQIEHVRGTPEKLGIGIRCKPDTALTASAFSFVGLTNVKIDGNELTDIYDHGIMFEYALDTLFDLSAVKTLSISGNTIDGASQGPEKRRAISIVASARAEDDVRAVKSVVVNDNVISGGDLEYGIFMVNSGVSADSFNPLVGSDLKAYSGGRGGCIDGNIVSAGASEAQIRVVGDRTVTFGVNVCDSLKFTDKIETQDHADHF